MTALQLSSSPMRAIARPFTVGLPAPLMTVPSRGEGKGGDGRLGR